MKHLFTILLAIILCFSSCTAEKPNDDVNELSRPVTNLEFWIAQNVDNVDFSMYQEKYGRVDENIMEQAILRH